MLGPAASVRRLVWSDGRVRTALLHAGAENAFALRNLTPRLFLDRYGRAQELDAAKAREMYDRLLPRHALLLRLAGFRPDIPRLGVIVVFVPCLVAIVVFVSRRHSPDDDGSRRSKTRVMGPASEQSTSPPQSKADRSWSLGTDAASVCRKVQGEAQERGSEGTVSSATCLRALYAVSGTDLS